MLTYDNGGICFRCHPDLAKNNWDEDFPNLIGNQFPGPLFLTYVDIKLVLGQESYSLPLHWLDEISGWQKLEPECLTADMNMTRSRPRCGKKRWIIRFALTTVAGQHYPDSKPWPSNALHWGQIDTRPVFTDCLASQRTNCGFYGSRWNGRYWYRGYQYMMRAACGSMWSRVTGWKVPICLQVSYTRTFQNKSNINPQANLCSLLDMASCYVKPFLNPNCNKSGRNSNAESSIYRSNVFWKQSELQNFEKFKHAATCCLRNKTLGSVKIGQGRRPAFHQNYLNILEKNR